MGDVSNSLRGKTCEEWRWRVLSRTEIVLRKLQELVDDSNEGTRLPSEDGLARLWDVSRPTVRSALATMEAKGYIVRRHGMGTYVSKSPISYPPIDSLLSVFEIVRRSGYTPAVTNVSISDVHVPTKVAKALDLPANDFVKRIVRTVTANDSPAIYLIDFLPYPPEDLAICEFDGETLSQFLRKTYNLSLGYAMTAISVAGASREVSQALAITKGAPVLHIEQTAYTENKEPVVYSLGYYREGIVTYTVMRRIDQKF